MKTRLATKVFWSAVILLAGGACASGTDTSGVVDAVLGEPPGAEAYSEKLRQALQEAVAELGSEYEPRTRHLRPDGTASYTNRLILESSPYLRQHAHNPVNWYPWGEEAFEAARRLGRPVLLSIGYSTCHWCHVMEEESFEDDEIAEFLNRNYIAIKVDREERPDLDAIYMRAVQSMVGRGGWPMTTWLTPDAEPFHGGTYFPARDGDRGARIGFLTLLRNLEEIYRTRPEQVRERAQQITTQLRRAALAKSSPDTEIDGALERAIESYSSRFDPASGGVRGEPKFPSSFPLLLMLRESERTGDPAPREMALLTLRRMANGGIHDQVGGGFHRYSTDAGWLVPHFEKMLYDNARLAVAYLEGFHASGDRSLAAVASATLDYALREMEAPSGGFYSATDADSLNPEGEREEGWFFTWTPEELREVLDEDSASWVARHYGVTPEGNFEGRSILHVVTPIEQDSRWNRVRKKLYEARADRPAPLRDDKVLTAWNSLMITALSRGSFILERPDYLVAAERTAGFVLENLSSDGRLLRSYNEGRARFKGYLDDYALLIAALIDLCEVSGDPKWLVAAGRLQQTLDRHFWDEESGGYFMTSDDHEQLLVREKPGYDGAMPSGNSVALLNLVRLHNLTLDDAYRARADALLGAFADKIARSPASLNEMLLAIQFEQANPAEILIVVPRKRNEAKAFLKTLRENYRPFHVMSVAIEGEDLSTKAQVIPPLVGKVARDGRATAYVCYRGVCRLPVVDAGAFLDQLSRGESEGDGSRPEKTRGSVTPKID